MKKKIIAVAAICAAITMSAGLAACNNTSKDTGTYFTVTYMDGTTVLKTEKVKKGEAPAAYTPTKDGGYQFVDWFATPSKNHRYDTTAAITENVTVYAGFTLYSVDTREFYIVGSGTSELLFTSNWGKVITDAHKLTKAADKNEYSITCDLKEGDQFQFVINTDWANKRGYGYLSSLTDANGKEVFSGQGSVYDDSSKGSNIVCEYSGNYTLTLKTYPNEDYYNTEGTGYTEERKEIYNLGTYDQINWVRNGDVVNNSVTMTDFYIKGASITGWKDMYNASTKMVNNGNEYTMSVYLKEGDQFMFTSQVTKIENGNTTVATGADYIKASELDDASKSYVDGTTNNMTAKASGAYTFTYNHTTKKLTVAFDAAAAQSKYDYYVDGNFNGGNYGDFITKPADFKLTETAEGSGVYEIKNVTLDKGKELLLRSYVEGETADWNHTHIDYQYAYLAANSAFEVASDTNNNIKVKTTGAYDITFDSYSKIITITEHIDSADTLDIYIKGQNINGWSHGWSEDYLFTLSADETKYEYTLTVEEDKAVSFGFEKHPKGETTGYGDYLGASAIGTSGDANDKFTPESGSNFTCSTAGTYKIVYNIETGKVDFYGVTE